MYTDVSSSVRLRGGVALRLSPTQQVVCLVRIRHIAR